MMELRECTAASPMPLDQAKDFYWNHADAVEVMPFFNLVVYQCPHCKFAFHALPRDK